MLVKLMFLLCLCNTCNMVNLAPTELTSVHYQSVAGCPSKTPSHLPAYQTVWAGSRLHCFTKCSRDSGCISATFLAQTKRCMFYDFIEERCSDLLHIAGSFYHFQTDVQEVSSHYCINGNFELTTKTCVCQSGYTGSHCDKFVYPVASDCSAILYQNGTYQQIQQIQPSLSSEPFDVRCGVGGLTYILSNEAQNNHFLDKQWQYMKDGFGKLEDDHWLGLDKIHEITSNANYDLVITVRYPMGTKTKVYYSHFVVKNEDNYYTTTMDYKYISSEFTLIDHALSILLYNLNGAMFSTKDKDNDGNPYLNCATENKMGFWWNSLCQNCTKCYEKHLISNMRLLSNM